MAVSIVFKSNMPNTSGIPITLSSVANAPLAVAAKKSNSNDDGSPPTKNCGGANNGGIDLQSYISAYMLCDIHKKLSKKKKFFDIELPCSTLLCRIFKNSHSISTYNILFSFF